jgi:diguanylate cyclase (GGDEF)-like protein
MIGRFGRFWLHEKIGQGGMAEIFRATVGSDPDVHSFDFAIKCLNLDLVDDVGQRDMFLAEAYLSKLMVHPNILRAYESGEADGRPYLAMEIIHGTDLAALQAALMSRHLAVPAGLAVYITLQTLRALDYIHRATAPGGKPLEIVHRDVSPSNIHILTGGEVKLGDFGVARARVLESPDDANLLKGKVAYMPPEALIANVVSQSGDLWSLGAILFEMLSGRRLYRGCSEPEILERADRFRPPTIADYGSVAIEAELGQIVAWSLEPKPSARPESAARFHRALNTYAHKAGFAVEPDMLAHYVADTLGRVAMAPGPERPPERDRLTGIYTYARMLEITQVELDRSKRHRRVFATLMIDVDDFSRVNAELGPEAGDDILKLVAQTLLQHRTGLRSSDVVGRRGEDRFVMLLPETPAAGGRVVADRVLAAFNATEWTQVEKRLRQPLTASIGVAAYPDHGGTVGALMEAAEVACYHAKEAGKNCVAVASSTFAELKTRIGTGTATPEEIHAWESFQSLHRHARGAQDPEQRRFERRRIVLPAQVADKTGNSVSISCEDVSTGGLRASVGMSLPSGTEIQLTLMLGSPPAAHQVQVRVAWQRKDGMTGFEFVELAPATGLLLAELVADEDAVIEGDAQPGT